MRINPRFRLLVPAAIALLAAGCDERSPVAVQAPQTGPRTLTFAYRCDGDVRSGLVRCAEPNVLPAGVSGLILGGAYVTLASSNVAYDAGTNEFTFDVTVKNHVVQPIGTTDGSTVDPDGIRVFFHSGPVATSGSGIITVVPDGFGTFTSAGQPYYQYQAVLDSGEVSGAKTWTLMMPPSVLTFTFTALVSAPVQFPDGWIDVTMDPVAVPQGGSPAIATAVARSAFGAVIADGPVSWGSLHPSVATVTSIDSTHAEVHGVSSGFAIITASTASRSGSTMIGVY